MSLPDREKLREAWERWATARRFAIRPLSNESIEALATIEQAALWALSIMENRGGEEERTP